MDEDTDDTPDSAPSAFDVFAPSRRERILPKHLLRSLLQAMAIRNGSVKGAPRRGTLSVSEDSRIRVTDVAGWIGVKRETLANFANDASKDIDAGLQIQLSNFFLLLQDGDIAKVRGPQGWAVERIARAPGAPPPKKAMIELSGSGLRISWSE